VKVKDRQDGLSLKLIIRTWLFGKSARELKTDITKELKVSRPDRSIIEWPKDSFNSMLEEVRCRLRV